MTTVVVSFRTDQEKRDRLEALAEARGLTWGRRPNPAPILRELVDDLLDTTEETTHEDDD